ncbi:MAG: hypothetical protein WAK56_16800, partial [Candidatus Sulfotelmatobacter sp.]
TMGPYDLSVVLYLLVVLFVSLFLLNDAVVTKRRQLLWILLLFWAVSASLIMNYSAVRDTGRWLVWSHKYKSKVLAEPAALSGELKHVEWDGWGFPGAGDTTEFVVFDPTDSLSAAARSHRPGKFNGIPCEVPLVRRLENHWYAVRFYTDEYWGRSNALNCGNEARS